MFEVKENACLSVTERLLYNIYKQLTQSKEADKKTVHAKPAKPAKAAERSVEHGKNTKSK